MKKTNQTYQVYVANNVSCGVLARGKKSDMIALFNETKNDPEYECVILSKWSVRYNCWQAIEKFYMYQ